MHVIHKYKQQAVLSAVGLKPLTLESLFLKVQRKVSVIT